ncbi:MAG TPA: hypothetical protein VFJ58_01390 [Armatimonadota bacterium]|nr:hypothetical protein [Armatimonadota bacterium]
MARETHYWKKAGRGLREADYPEVDEASVTFPPTIGVAYAVCTKECGRAEFIVDGSTQICHYCGRSMFRIVSKLYRLEEEAEPNP